MKIAISSLSDICMNEGTSLRAKRILELLQKKYDCTLIIRGQHDSKFDNVEVIKPSKLWNLQLIPVFLKNRFDLVYCSNDYWGFFTYFALAKLLPCKVIFEAHGILSLERKLSLAHTPTNKVSFKMVEMAREVRDQTRRLRNRVSSGYFQILQQPQQVYFHSRQFRR